MEFCDVPAVAAPFGALPDWPMETRPGVGISIIDALAELHALDPADVGLADLGRPDGYVERQLNRWFDSWQRSHEAAQIDVPSLSKSFDILSRHIPKQGPARVCHGDFAPHNLLITDEGELRAIMDWEISTLGDPSADLTYFLWSRGSGPFDPTKATRRSENSSHITSGRPGKPSRISGSTSLSTPSSLRALPRVCTRAFAAGCGARRESTWTRCASASWDS